MLMVVFLLEACVGGLAYLYERHIADELMDTMNNTFLTSYAVDPAKTKAIDAMQQDVSVQILQIVSRITLYLYSYIVILRHHSTLVAVPFALKIGEKACGFNRAEPICWCRPTADSFPTHVAYQRSKIVDVAIIPVIFPIRYVVCASKAKAIW